MNVGLTGGIACGKSTVSRMFAKRSARIVDADAIARDVVLPGRPALAQISERFGGDILQQDGTLNRKKLGEIVFSDPKARSDLEAITHPAIRAEMLRQMEHWNEAEPGSLVIMDIPLLYESKLDKLFDFESIIVVYVPKEVQLERLMERDGLTGEAAAKRLASQMPIEEKKRLADTVIDNSGTTQETERQVEQFLAQKGYI